MHVAVHYHGSAGGAKETAADIESGGGRATLFHADLSQPTAPESLVTMSSRTLGTLDVLVNSAAIMQRTPLDSVTPADWDATFRHQRPGAVLRCHCRPSPHGRPRRRDREHRRPRWTGNVASIGAARPVQDCRCTDDSCAGENAGASVRVNAVAPGVIMLPEGWEAETGERLRRTTPLKRLGSVNDVVGAVIYLLEATT
jgi:NAD(P)-dependent dehydrogenase (short-subunit alcohol dehydrogenase family)